MPEKFILTDGSYAEACLPDGWRIFGKRLRPFAAGHFLLLERIGSPFLMGGKAKLTDLMVAVWICSQGYEAAAGGLFSKLRLGWQWWSVKIMTLCLLMPIEYAETRIAMFERYLSEGMAEPRVWFTKGAWRNSTVPAMLLKKAVLMSQFGYSAGEFLDMPLKQATAEYMAYLERESACKFYTHEDAEMAERVKREREEAKAPAEAGTTYEDQGHAAARPSQV